MLNLGNPRTHKKKNETLLMPQHFKKGGMFPAFFFTSYVLPMRECVSRHVSCRIRDSVVVSVDLSVVPWARALGTRDWKGSELGNNTMEASGTHERKRERKTETNSKRQRSTKNEHKENAL
jgi:hypothetical protein